MTSFCLLSFQYHSDFGLNLSVYRISLVLYLSYIYVYEYAYMYYWVYVFKIIFLNTFLFLTDRMNMLQKFAGQDEVLASDIETLIKANPQQDGDYVRVGKPREPL